MLKVNGREDCVREEKKAPIPRDQYRYRCVHEWYLKSLENIGPAGPFGPNKTKKFYLYHNLDVILTHKHDVYLSF
jgi:hypothetical protein